MNHRPLAAILAPAILASLLLASCPALEISSFRWKSASGGDLPFTQSAGFPKGKENIFSAARSRNTYTLRKALEPEPGLMAAARFEVKSAEATIGFSLGPDAKHMSPEVRFGAKRGVAVFYLSIPESSPLKTLRITVDASRDSAGEKEENGAKDETTVAELESIAILPAFRGFEVADGEYRISDGIALDRPAGGASRWTIKKPFAGMESAAAGESPAMPLLVLRYAERAGADIVIEAGSKIVARCESARKEIRIPSTVFPGVSSQPEMTIVVPDTVRLESAYIEAVPAENASALDPGLILLQPRLKPGEDFAWYRWDLLPGVLMFDFRDYAVQDAYLKRLAFFVEKKGYAGRLAKDEEIASLHGWNAHDYKAEDVARFFSTAEKEGFPLNEEELRLRDFLLEKGLIAKKGRTYSGGDGAIISISQESAPYLRHTFLTHESSHAIFFADARYREACLSLWASMSREEKWFWILYFGWMNYDTSSSYLMASEMQAYLIQQPVKKAEEYFTKTLVDRLLENHPELEDQVAAYMGEFGDSFAEKAGILDAWLRSAYGFGAGTTFFLR